MKKLLLYSNLLFLLGCGIPDSSSFETLLAPIILDDKTTYPKCTFNPATKRLKIELKVLVYNIESSFSGYNIYLAPTVGSSGELDTTLRNAVSNHIRKISGNNTFNTDTEKTFIIKQRSNSLPTVPAGDPSITGYNKQPTEVIMTIEKFPNNTYLTQQPYGFTVTAVSLPNVAESQMGNTIAIDGTKATTTTPIYCGYTP